MLDIQSPKQSATPTVPITFGPNPHFNKHFVNGKIGPVLQHSGKRNSFCVSWYPTTALEQLAAPSADPSESSMHVCAQQSTQSLSSGPEHKNKQALILVIDSGVHVVVDVLVLVLVLVLVEVVVEVVVEVIVEVEVEVDELVVVEVEDAVVMHEISGQPAQKRVHFSLSNAAVKPNP